MSKITDVQWDEAVNRCQELLSLASSLPDGTGMFYVASCKNMLKKYLDGNRTKELYDEMINLR